MRKQRRRSASPLFSLHGQYNPSTSNIRNFKALAILSGCTAWFVCDLVENPKDRFSQNKAQISSNMHFICSFGRHVSSKEAQMVILTCPCLCSFTIIDNTNAAIIFCLAYKKFTDSQYMYIHKGILLLSSLTKMLKVSSVKWRLSFARPALYNVCLIEFRNV